jgi:hypothetical protein
MSLVKSIRRYLDEIAIEKAKLELHTAAEPKSQDSKSLSEHEAALKLGVGERTIRRYVAQRKLKRTKNGRIACDAKWQKMFTKQ